MTTEFLADLFLEDLCVRDALWEKLKNTLQTGGLDT